MSNQNIENLNILYKHLSKHVKPEWNDIPSGDIWKLQFNRKYNNLVGKFIKLNIEESEAIEEDLKAKNDEKVGKLEAKEVAANIYRALEGTWLEMRSRIEAIKNESNSKPLDLDKLVNYAISIGGTSCSPPETNNIIDEMMHSQIFPRYHFLGRIGIKDIHASRFFYLKDLTKVIFPPIIHFLDGESEDLKKLKITCSTKGCRIFFKVNDNEKIREYTGEMPFKAIPFKLSVWATADGMTQSQVVQANYIPKSESYDSLHSELFLGKG